MVETIDNAGQITWTQSDLAGRTLRTIESYVPAGLDQNGNPVAADTAEDVTTDYQYDTFGRLATLTAYDAQHSRRDRRRANQIPLPIDAGRLVADNGGLARFDRHPLAKLDDPRLDNHQRHGPGDLTTYDWMGRTTTQTDERGVVHCTRTIPRHSSPTTR